jgi:hypothetical protein
MFQIGSRMLICGAVETAAVTEELMAFSGQQATATHAIEKPETKFLLEIADLSGPSRLTNVQRWRPTRSKTSNVRSEFRR